MIEKIRTKFRNRQIKSAYRIAAKQMLKDLRHRRDAIRADYYAIDCWRAELAEREQLLHDRFQRLSELESDLRENISMFSTAKKLMARAIGHIDNAEIQGERKVRHIREARRKNA